MQNLKIYTINKRRRYKKKEIHSFCNFANPEMGPKIYYDFGFYCHRHLFLSKTTLCEIPKFHLISWCENFVEAHSFRRVSGDSPETLQKLYFSTKFSHQESR